MIPNDFDFDFEDESYEQNDFGEDEDEDEIEPSKIETSKTYKMDLERNIIAGTIDEQEALKQAIFKILNTERYKEEIYSNGYGIELEELIGEPFDYVCAELERVIKEALTQDTRIIDVSDFEFEENSKKSILKVKFTVNSIFGYDNIEQEVEI